MLTQNSVALSEMPFYSLFQSPGVRENKHKHQITQIICLGFARFSKSLFSSCCRSAFCFALFCLQSKKGPCRRNYKKTHLFLSLNSDIHLFLLHHLRAYKHSGTFALPSSPPRAPDVRGCAPALTDRSIKKWPPCPCVKPNTDSAGALCARNAYMCARECVYTVTVSSSATAANRKRLLPASFTLHYM